MRTLRRGPLPGRTFPLYASPEVVEPVSREVRMSELLSAELGANPLPIPTVPQDNDALLVSFDSGRKSFGSNHNER